MEIAIIGHFGADKVFNDGQTVKTVTLYKALKNTKELRIKPIDTYYLRHNPFRFAWVFLVSLFSCKKYIVLLSVNGRKVLFPVLYVASKYFKKQIYHNSIGGRLADEAAKDARFKKYICSFESNWVESRLITNKLKAQGVNNVVYIPNFKQIEPLTENDLPKTANQPMRFCTFSRVMKEKGITDAIEAVAELNKDKILATLTVYGPIENTYKAEFDQLLKKYKNFCAYGGIIGANESVKVLKDYDMLLFPTRYFREGMPGTVIDAFCAGLPILARRWAYCDEMITHLKIGLIYDFDKPQELKTWLEYALKHPQKIYEMKENCLTAGRAYTEKAVLPQILTLLEGK